MADYLPILIAVLAPAVFLSISAAMGPLGTYLRERAHASRVARLTDTVGRVAGDIAERLLAQPASTPAAVIGAVKTQLVADGQAYIQAAMPDTVRAVGIQPDTLVAMLSRETGRQMLTAAGAVADALAQALKVGAPGAPSA